jgi:hypothetical protein
LTIEEDLTGSGNERPVFPKIFYCLKFTNLLITSSIILFLKREGDVRKEKGEKNEGWKHTPVEELCSQSTHLFCRG